MELAPFLGKIILQKQIFVKAARSFPLSSIFPLPPTMSVLAHRGSPWLRVPLLGGLPVLAPYYHQNPDSFVASVAAFVPEGPMLVSWRYRDRNTPVQKLDPRARWIFMLAALFSVIQFWDLRFLLFFFALTLAYYLLCRLTWQETCRTWTFVLVLVVAIIGLNTVLTGRGGPTEVLQGRAHIV